MPAPMHSFYLRNMYQRDLLKEPGGIALAGAPIDLRMIRTPAYFLSATAEDWFAAATQHEGSWWEDWGRWIAGFSGKPVPAREPGGGVLAPLEDAPGSYVKVRIA